jgi:hypothetical protein
VSERRTAARMVARGEAARTVARERRGKVRTKLRRCKEDENGRGWWGCGQIIANRRRDKPWLEEFLGKMEKTHGSIAVGKVSERERVKRLSVN